MTAPTLDPTSNTELRQAIDADPRIIAVYPTAIVINLTDAVGAALYRQWERWNAAEPDRPWTLERFIQMRLADLALGPGADPGAAADWLERR